MHTPTSPFKFNYISIEKMVHEINSIKSSKALPIDSLPARILKGNSDLPVILYNNFNNCISSCEFPDQLKLADVSPVYKKGEGMIRLTIAQSVFFQSYRKFMKGLCSFR